MIAALAIGVQAFLVNAIKRRALVALHATRRGEALLLNMYLWAEEGAEGAVLRKALATGMPQWLAEQTDRHLRDEERHAALLRKRLADLGAAPGGLKVDALSRWKLRSLEKLAGESAAGFRQGVKVPIFAIAYRLEAMGVRVLERHLEVCSQLAERGGEVAPTRELLQQVTADERHHVQACERVLQRLVTDDDEQPKLAKLLGRIDAVERAFGVCGAVGMLAVGYAFQLLPAKS